MHRQTNNLSANLDKCKKILQGQSSVICAIYTLGQVEVLVDL